MIIADLKPLFRRMSPVLTRAVEQGAGLCLSRTHYEITPEHVIVSLLDHPDSDFMKILATEGIERESVRREMSNALDDLRSGNGGRPVFSPLLIEVLQDAHLISYTDRRIPRNRNAKYAPAPGPCRCDHR